MVNDNTVESSVALAEAVVANHAPIIRSYGEHGISRRDIDPDAKRVIYTLCNNDFTAYLVGGGVRDLLLGRKPKDFDISTSARPEQVRKLFKKCFLIGRRFRLAHIKFGNKIIETSTFRRTPDNTVDPNDPEADLFQRDDNQFGTPEEDALRRDFTVNGLFYDIENFTVIDYVGGIDDLKQKRIRSIGDPCIRFREDPVRMIRAIRFASRLDFEIDPVDLDAIGKHKDELAKASPARLLEEIFRLFAFSAGEKAVGLLESTGVLEVILPEISQYLKSTADASPFWRRLAALDHGDTVLAEATPSLILAAIIAEPMRQAIKGIFDPRQRTEKIRGVLGSLSSRLQVPRKMKDRIIRVLTSQSRFTNPGRKRATETLVNQEWFPEALAFAEMEAIVDGKPLTSLNPWHEKYAEKICRCNDDDPRHQGKKHKFDLNNNGNNGNNGNHNGSTTHHTAKTVDLPENALEHQRAEPAENKPLPAPGQGQSRSARRRRNRQKNRERKIQEQLTRPGGQQQEQVNDDNQAQPTTAVTKSPNVAAVTRPAKESKPLPAAQDEPKEQTAEKKPSSWHKREDEAGTAETTEKTEPRTTAKPSRKAASKATASRKRAPSKTAEAKTDQAKKTRGKTQVKVPEPVVEESAQTEDGIPPKPLTAASFYMQPKKPAKAKSSSAKVKKGKKPTEKTAATSDSVRLLHTFDASEEADHPMHWLDEI